jgi:hypothetical protein
LLDEVGLAVPARPHEGKRVDRQRRRSLGDDTGIDDPVLDVDQRLVIDLERSRRRLERGNPASLMDPRRPTRGGG